MTVAELRRELSELDGSAAVLLTQDAEYTDLHVVKYYKPDGAEERAVDHIVLSNAVVAHADGPDPLTISVGD